MTATPDTPPPPKTPPQLRPARFDDYPQIERLEASHGLLTLPDRDWRALWLDNPLRDRLGDAWPIGWVLEDESGRVVGSLTNIPTLYVHRGRELVAVTGRAWVVAPEYRGVALWLMDEYFNQEGADLFINTTVNAHAVEAFGAFGSSRVPLGNWETTTYWVTGYRGFAASALRIKGVPLPGLLAPAAAAALRIKDALTLDKPPASAEVEQAGGFDARFDAFWDELVRQRPETLLGVRDCRTLNWHFAGPLRSGHVWIFLASRHGRIRAYGILKRHDHPPSGLMRMRWVDYQTLAPDEDLLTPLVAAALRRCESEGIHVLEHVGLGLPKMRGLDRAAPYRRKLAAWPYYYKAADPGLDAALREPEAWDPSAYDGDSSL